MRSAVVFIACVLVAGCTNLKSVSDFAASGAGATNAGSVFASYVDAELNAVRLAYPPTDHPTQDERDRRAVAQRLSAKAPDYAKADSDALRALSLYFSVLSSLSSNTLISVSDSATSINSSLKTLNATASSSVPAATSLTELLFSAPLDAWRNAAVGNLITGANKDVMTLCTDLATDARLVAAAWASDIEAANSYYGSISGPPNDIRGAILMMAIANQQTSVFAANQQKALALGTALDNICSGQKTLDANVGKLDSSTVIANLNGYKAEIESAATLIHK